MKLNTIPNWITLIRFGLFIVTLFLLLGNFGEKWMALPVYIICFLLDKADGWVARKYNQVSDWGKFFDLSTDRAIVTSLLVCYVYFFPNIWILIILIINLIRDFMVAGLRQLAAIKNLFLKAHILGKMKFISENLSVILMVYLMSQEQLGADIATMIHRIILVILIAGSVVGWMAFGLYFKQVSSIKEK